MSLQFPSSPTSGQTFPSPLQPGQPSWVWDGAKWTSRGLANAMVSTSPLPPLNPRVGDLWFDPVEGNTYVYFDDGNSQQWVVTINQPGDFPRMGVADGSNAVPGEVGEVLSNSTNAVNVTANQWTAVCNVSLPAGDWYCSGSCFFTSTTSENAVAFGLHTIAQVIPPIDYTRSHFAFTAGTFTTFGCSFPSCRFNVSQPTTVYLNVTASPGNGAATSIIEARRMR